ncbi:hypothetical protein [Paenibacillus prosopidis]|nr:hypothetical protein [Paenibacillus prosopidis]
MMKYTRNDTSKASVLAAASALVILLAGCQSASTAPSDPYISNSSLNYDQSEKEPDSPQKMYSEQTNNELFSDEPHANRADMTNGTNAETSTLHNHEDDKATVKTESEDAAWTATAPMLHGVAIGDSDAKVRKLFGKEIDSYTLEEETETIKVLEYAGFAIGINDSNAVHYIEVYGNDISAGLSGLQVGDKPDQALQMLGKPEKQTTYLLTYKASGALLKLDLDPEQNEIVSIKLLTIS